jgi:serine/threonine-protein kinase
VDRIGRYKIVRELGRGAMGVVYHAIDPNIGRPLAIKTINFGGSRKPEEVERMRDRLFREARSAGILSHPGIVTIYDVEQQGDIAYIAMEYVDGPTLDQVLSEKGAIAADRMFSILAQTAAALDYAHSKGIVHRDIKPANIMLTADGTCKITDFGIAKINTAEHLTMTGSIVGTPHYMSPEQVQGQHVDGRSDQFSLAVIAYEMLTGEKPYTGEHLTTVVYKIVAEEPVPPHRINPGLAGVMEVVLRKALAKKPDARYATCQDFVDALEQAGAATKGWKPLPRGGMLHEPTVSEMPAAASVSIGPSQTLPPPRRTRLADATGATTAQRKVGFLPFLLAILVAAALLALIGWQAAPWMKPAAQNSVAENRTPPKEEPPPQSTATSPVPATEPAPPAAQPAENPGAAPPAENPGGTQPQTQPAETQPGGSPAATQSPVSQPPATQPSGRQPPENQPPANQPPANQPVVNPPSGAQPAGRVPAHDESKPSPVGPPAEGGQPKIRPVPKTAPPLVPAARGPREVALQDVAVTSSPAGATVSVDGNSTLVCPTPCSLKASSGRHTLVVTMPGYQMQRLEFDVGNAPLELPPVFLTRVGGTLMLSSDVKGASIWVDGRRTDLVTPAQVPLPLGPHTIMVEKDGRQDTAQTTIHDGLNHLRLSIGK